MPIVGSNDKGEFTLEEVDLDSWKSTFRRVLLNGPPLSGKTTALKTFPAKRHLLIAPGELGHSSIQEDDDTKIYYWEFDPNATKVAYSRVWAHIQVITTNILKGMYGDITTFGIDGLHKLYYVIMKSHGFTPDSDPRDYVRYHETFTNYMNSILQSPTPFVVATSYDGVEALEAGSKISQIFPDLPGKMAKQVMGMFPCVFHTERSGDDGKEKYIWRLRANGKIQGVGMHLPQDIKAKFPAEIEPDWQKVEACLE